MKHAVTITVWVERTAAVEAVEVMTRSLWNSMTPAERQGFADDVLFNLIKAGREAVDEKGNELDWDAQPAAASRSGPEHRASDEEREALLAVARAADEMPPYEMSKTLAAALSHAAVRALLDGNREHDESELERKASAPEATTTVTSGIDDYGRTSLAARVRELTPAQVLQVNQLLDGEAQEPRVELEGFAARHIAAQIDARNGNPEPLRQLIKEYSARLAEAGGLDARE